MANTLLCPSIYFCLVGHSDAQRYVLCSMEEGISRDFVHTPADITIWMTSA